MRAAPIVIAILFSAACTAGGGPTGDDAGDDSGGDDVPPGDDEPPPPDLTPQEFIEQLITAECDKAFSCEAEYPTTEGTFADDWGATESECLTDDDDYLQRDDVAAAVAAGRIIYNADSAEDCLLEPEYPATCAAFFTTYDWPDSCYEALIGTVVDGGTCTTWWECGGEDADCISGACAPATDDEE